MTQGMGPMFDLKDPDRAQIYSQDPDRAFTEGAWHGDVIVVENLWDKSDKEKAGAHFCCWLIDS